MCVYVVPQQLYMETGQYRDHKQRPIRYFKTQFLSTPKVEIAPICHRQCNPSPYTKNGWHSIPQVFRI